MSFLNVFLPPDLSAINDSNIVRTMYNCVDDGPTFLLGTFILKPPLSGSFLPFKAGSAKGSTPLCQSAHVSRTDIIMLKVVSIHHQIGGF